MFEELAEFVRNKRKTGMSHGYQQLLIKTLVATGGTAMLRRVAMAFLMED